jgi:hypothetical protein
MFGSNSLPINRPISTIISEKICLFPDINFEFTEKEKLSYHIAYSRLGVNKNATTVALERLKKQTGAVLGMNYKFPIQENFDLETILEYANIKNINGKFLCYISI